MTDIDEYHAFGPWVAEVSSEEGLPSAFRHWWTSLATSSLVFKIPIASERREVKPGMDLYRQVIAADPQGLKVLSLSEPERLKEFAWSDLRGIVLSHLLLKGVLEFSWDSGSRTVIEFNAVSLPLMERLVDSVRPAASAQAEAPPNLAVADYHQQNLIAAHGRRRSGFHVAVCDAPSKRKQGVLVLESDREWVVLDSGADKHSKASAYAERATYLVKDSVRGVRVTPAPRMKGQWDGWLDGVQAWRFRLGPDAAEQFAALRL